MTVAVVDDEVIRVRDDSRSGEDSGRRSEHDSEDPNTSGTSNPANGYRLSKRSDLEKFLKGIERPHKRI